MKLKLTPSIIGLAIALFIFSLASPALGQGNTKANARKPLTLKAGAMVNAELKELLDGKTLKEGDNIFNLKTPGIHINIQVTSGKVTWSRLVYTVGSKVINVDLMSKKFGDDGPVIRACWTAYRLCIARCASAGKDQHCAHCDI